MLSGALPDDLKSKLDELLSSATNPRFAIAFSGGGDSTALLQVLAGHEHCAAVYIVDHGLRRGSAKEAELARIRAQALGYSAQILTWRPEMVKTGLQEKARKARYALMGRACRENDIPFLVTAHTQGDQAETLLMRYERGTDWRGAAGMAESTFAPLWPELASVTLLRPALSMTREDLRSYNRENSLEWIEDPSNENTSFKRIETRQYLKSRSGLADTLISAATDLQKGREAEQTHLRARAQNVITYGVMGDMRLTNAVPSQLLNLCLHAVSGSGEPVRAEALQRLAAAMSKPNFKGATLGGTQIMPDVGGYHISRDPGAVLGRNNKPRLPDRVLTEKPTLWDGRFWVEGQVKGACIVPFWPERDRLTSEQRKEFRAIPKSVRKTLPAVVVEGELAAVAGGLKHPDIQIISAVQSHLEGRLGPA